MKNLFKTYYPYLIIFVVSLILIFPYLKRDYIIALGESQIYVNASYIDFYSMWLDKLNLGSFAANQNNIFLFSIIWAFLKLFSSFIHPSVLFTFLSYFLPSLFFYICLNNILYVKNKLFLIPGSLLFSFNVFRTLGTINERTNLLFIFLPLFFLFYYKLLHTRNWKYVFVIIIISLLSSALGGNLPVFTIPYLLMFSYFTYFLFKNKFHLEKIILLQNLVLIFLIIFANIFWLFPLSLFLSNVLKLTNSGVGQFSALTAGDFFDYFRFIGSWAWRSGHYISLYYPFSIYYDTFFFGLSTYLVPIFAFIYLTKTNKKSLEIYILFLSIFSFLMLAGVKEPFGFIYKFFYDNFSVLRMYREPLTKFMPLWIFSVAFSLVFSILYLSKKIKNFTYVNLIVIFLTLLVLLNAFPLLTTQAMIIKYWNAGPSGYVAVIPDYWKEAKKYIENTLSDERLTIMPHNNYSASHNWEYGTTIVGNAADYLFDVPNIKDWDWDGSETGKFIKLLLNTKNKKIDLKYSLGLLNSRYILQENDLEWRYSQPENLSPSKSNEFIIKSGFKKIAEFGKFTPEYLNKIQNKEPDIKKRNQFTKELLNQPALILYKMDDKYFLPHFYIPQNIVYFEKSFEKITDLLGPGNFNINSVIYSQLQKNNKIVSSTGVENLPSMNFKKINSTKYLVNIRKAKTSFPLVFIETFHPEWKVFVGKTNFFSNPISEDYHQLANGFINSWIIDPKLICLNNNCQKNQDGSYDINLTVEFALQKYVNLTYITTGIIFIASILFVIYSILKKKPNNL